ncbi:MAG TPA: hypothetical protein VFH94_04485 [Streptomyces sp.]|nr:hypothetical protein [Streptomyces sp.]
MDSRHRLHDLARLTFGNRASQVYLGLVAAIAVFVAVDTLFVTHEDASLAGVWLFTVAAPTAFVFLIAGTVVEPGVIESTSFMILTIALSVLIQSLALGLFARLLRGAARPAHPQGA